MSQAELFRRVAQVLTQLEIDWMVVGSHASSFYGEPRSTHDVDIVFDLPDSKRNLLVQQSPSDRYYLSDIALRERRMANLIDTQTGDKADLFFAIDEQSLQQLQRRKSVRMLGTDVFISSAEDTIVAKLKWNHQMGGSQRQIGDVRSIVAVRGDRLNRELLFRLLLEADLMESWQSEIEPAPEES